MMANTSEHVQRLTRKQNRYENQLDRVKRTMGFTKSIEDTVLASAQNLSSEANSFVIYGEPQSGKTEMMICLVAKILDLDFRTIVVLVNDSIDLQNQNLRRFQFSGISPTPMSLSDILNSDLNVKKKESIVFCKKNSKDLKKLIERLRGITSIVVIDDEADFATPNAKINKAEETKINELVKALRALGKPGAWIGVTATPARLDLNNTLGNIRPDWVHFSPHPEYCGHEVFFPKLENSNIAFELKLLPDEYDAPATLRTALMRFVVNVAHLNYNLKVEEQENYCMIVHTSGIKTDHDVDRKLVEKYFIEISDTEEPAFEKRWNEISKYTDEEYGPKCREEILRYIADNCSKNLIRVINSDADKTTDVVESATNPPVPFTVAIGGNIISRGVTFNNLLGMFFTRSTKTVQQDTYIQRARMFGNRRKYLDHFELHIPKTLYGEWHRAFSYHRLALASIKSGEPVWLEDSGIRAVARSSIDKMNVYADKGEISFGLIEFSEALRLATQNSIGGLEAFKNIMKMVPADYVSRHILEFVDSLSINNKKLVAWHFSGQIEKFKDADYQQIQRDRGFFGKGDLELNKFPDATHHFKFYYNKHGKARLFYKYTENTARIRFIKWRSRDPRV